MALRKRRIERRLHPRTWKNGFVVAADKRDELSKLLGELGFALDAACTLEAVALPAAPRALSKSTPALRRVPGSR